MGHTADPSKKRATCADIVPFDDWTMGVNATPGCDCRAPNSNGGSWWPYFGGGNWAWVGSDSETLAARHGFLPFLSAGALRHVSPRPMNTAGNPASVHMPNCRGKVNNFPRALNSPQLQPAPGSIPRHAVPRALLNRLPQWIHAIVL
jgi:hypothetical protein